MASLKKQVGWQRNPWPCCKRCAYGVIIEDGKHVAAYWACVRYGFRTEPSATCVNWLSFSVAFNQKELEL